MKIAVSRKNTDKTLIIAVYNIEKIAAAELKRLDFIFRIHEHTFVHSNILVLLLWNTDNKVIEMNSDETDIVKDYIQKIGCTTRKLLMTKFYRDIDPIALSNIEQTLQQLGCIKIKLLPDQGDKQYTWIGE